MHSSSRKRSFDADTDSRHSSHKRSRGDDRARPVPRRTDRVQESDGARAWRLAKKAIVELGDADSRPSSRDVSTTTTQQQLLHTRDLLLQEVEADAQGVKLGHLVTLVLRAAARVAHKTALYATLVALLNARHPGFGQALVAGATRALELDLAFFCRATRAHRAEAVDMDGFRRNNDRTAVAIRVRLLVRFLAALSAVNVCAVDNVLELLDAIQRPCTALADGDREEDEDEAATGGLMTMSSVRAKEDAAAWKDFFALVVLDALLHGGHALVRASRRAGQTLWSRCKEYVLYRGGESNLRTSSAGSLSWRSRRLQMDLLWGPEDDDELPALCASSDVLSLVYEALSAVQSAEGEDKAVVEHFSGVEYSLDDFASKLENAEVHSFTVSLAIDLLKLDSNMIPAYTAWFRILTEESGVAGAAVATMPLASYLILRSHVTDTLETSYPKPAIAAKLLLDLCRTQNARFAASVAEGASPVKTEYLLVETLLVAALSESTNAKLAYYCSMLYHLVKTDPSMVSPALAVVVELLFRQVPMMRAAAVDSFVLLLSHFLSNFEFKWRWTAWSYVLEASEDDPQRLFVSAVIERCVRLSYLQHMQSTLPAEFHVLLPPAPKPRIRFHAAKEEDVTVCAMADETSPASEFYQSVTTKLKGHPPVAALHSWLNEELPRLEISRTEAIEVVWTCILEAGAATFTHMRLLLEKYGKRGELLGISYQLGEDVTADELALVKTVASVWLKSPQHIGLILNAMLRLELFRPVAIVTWVFTPDAVQQYSWPYVWEILRDTLKFVQDAIDAKTQKMGQAAVPRSSEDRDEEMLDVATLEDDRKRLQEEMRQLLLLLFKGFNRVLTEHKAECEGEDSDPHDNWFHSTLAQMRAIGHRYRVPLEGALDELQLGIFSTSASADADAIKLFQLIRDTYRSA
uniref:Nuclear cap-binding protein subunit 1 n=1 Tax=Peronospora matthiolae TaxID=2874970 RepID=A0AAV1U4W3_9STRA